MNIDDTDILHEISPLAVLSTPDPFSYRVIDYSGAALLEFSRIWPTYFRCWCFFNF